MPQYIYSDEDNEPMYFDLIEEPLPFTDPPEEEDDGEDT